MTVTGRRASHEAGSTPTRPRRSPRTLKRAENSPAPTRGVTRTNPANGCARLSPVCTAGLLGASPQPQPCDYGQQRPSGASHTGRANTHSLPGTCCDRCPGPRESGLLAVMTAGSPTFLEKRFHATCIKRCDLPAPGLRTRDLPLNVMTATTTQTKLLQPPDCKQSPRVTPGHGCPSVMTTSRCWRRAVDAYRTGSLTSFHLKSQNLWVTLREVCVRFLSREGCRGPARRAGTQTAREETARVTTACHSPALT